MLQKELLAIAYSAIGAKDWVFIHNDMLYWPAEFCLWYCRGQDLMRYGSFIWFHMVIVLLNMATFAPMMTRQVVGVLPSPPLSPSCGCHYLMDQAAGRSSRRRMSKGSEHLGGLAGWLVVNRD